MPDVPLAPDAASADVLDPWRLAALLVPGLSQGERGKLARALDLPLPPVEPRDAAARLREGDTIVAACLERLRRLDATTLQSLAHIFSGTRLPEASVVERAFREHAQQAFADTGISRIPPTAGGAESPLAGESGAEGDNWSAGGPPPPVLQPTRTRTAVDQQGIHAAFKPDGPLAKALPGYEARLGQLKMARAVAKALSDRLHLIVEAGTGTGKALDVDTPIPTPDGWKRMGDFQVGDSVFDETGQVTSVTAAFAVMHDRPCYEVEFSDHSTLVADAEHEWITYSSRDRKWESRPRGEVYRQKRFATAAILSNIRSCIEEAADDRVFKSLREASQLIGGHIWSVRSAAEDLALAPNANGFRRAAARPLLAAVLNRLERDVREQRRDAPPFTIATTEEIAATLTDGKSRRLNHAVPVTKPLDLPDADLPIDPYFLGAWLGDGNSRRSQIVSADPQVLVEIERSGYTARRLASHEFLYAVDDENGKARSCWQPGLTGRLRRLGVIQNKHIPQEYLRSSERQRRQLLAGLLDTDGTVSPGGAVELTTTNSQIARGGQELVNSLGYRGSLRESRARLRGKDCGPMWTLAFTTDEEVFRLHRKQATHRVRGGRFSANRNRLRYIVAVRPVPSRPVRCIQVAAPSHLYLAGRAFIPTHNSLAYLLPAATYAVANGRRVVVSTNTINLQEQLYFKDIPLLRRAMADSPVAVPFIATVLKGRANYLCLRRWRGFLREGLQSDADRLLAAKVLLWLPQTESGDRSELALDDREAARWATSLAADALHCTPKLCREHRAGRCFLARARRRAEGAHIVVVNHALLLADQALESKVLPEYADLVVDEAHHLEDVATRQLAANIDQQELLNSLAALSQQQGPGRYAGLISRVQATLISAGGAPMRSQAGELTQPAHDAAEAARRAIAEFFAAVAGFLRQDISDAPPTWGSGRERWNAPTRGAGTEISSPAERDLRLTASVRAAQGWTPVELAWEEGAKTLGALQTAMARILDALEPFSGSAEAVDDALADLTTVQRQLAEVGIALSAIVSSPSADQVYWITGRDRGLTLHAAPLDVGQLLQQQLFTQKDCVVLTTATAQVGGSFRYLRERLGLDQTTFTLAVPSPFDYPAQALLCVPSDLPDPSDRAFPEASHHALSAICQATGGRTLVLFTSHAALRAAHEHLRPRLRGLTVLGQGLDGARQQLLERFREAPGIVLLGTSSFWEGIDVVGDALSCLVIVKLPFSVPSDPVFAARSEQFADPFTEYALPQAVLRLKQGFGRLIRSGQDRGVVAVLDSRLWTKRYGTVFLRSLPPATQQRCSWREMSQLTHDWLNGTGMSAAGAGRPQ